MILAGPSELTAPSGDRLYRAEYVANMLESAGQFELSDPLRIAAAVIESNYVSGRETYVRHFQQMGFLEAVVKKQLPDEILQSSVALGKEYLSLHERIVSDAFLAISAMQDACPDLLYAGDGARKGEPKSLLKVVGFAIGKSPGDIISGIQPVFEDDLTLVRTRTALCDIKALPVDAEMRDSVLRQREKGL